jgi:ATP-dependent protease ClpP protease subunit
VKVLLVLGLCLLWQGISLAIYPIYVVIDGPIVSTKIVEKDGKVYTIQGTTSKLMASIKQAIDITPSTEVVTDIVVLIISPGGEVTEALATYSYLQLLKPKYHIITVATGLSASAAMTILQAGDIRCATNNTFLMTHKPLYVFPNETSYTTTDGARYDASLNKCNEMMIRLFADRMGVPKEKIRKYFQDTPTDMYGAWDAYKIGFIDVIIYDSSWKYRL